MAVDHAQVDAGATAWLLISAALVLLMTPGMAFFYGGMVRVTHVLGTVMLSLATMGTVTIIWLLVGFSLAFGAGNGIVGGFQFAFLTDLTAAVPGVDPTGVPLLAFVMFQLTFAIITPALITGAGAERWRFGAFVPFIGLWSLLVYAPVAHWVFSPLGWLHELGALDFAGGTVVHANAGAAALVIAARLGRRVDWPGPRHRPHNLPLMLLGMALLWFGWFGFNGGSALTADGVSALAVVNTQAAAATALMSWALAERIRFGKPTALGAASGAVSGLVAITPAAGYVTPVGAVLIGAVAGVICHLAVGLKSVLRLDDALDVAAVHLGGGVVGSLAVGLLATKSANPAAVDGLFYGGGYRLLGAQAIGVLAVVAYSIVATLLLSALIDRIFGNRVSSRDELIGLDLSQHGESAYSFDPPPKPSARESAARTYGQAAAQPGHPLAREGSQP
ncbi:ammonium transporter [Micromonospora sp. CB01531]|uniref:ammonium transporter n=1 Tax=Micromonospora sp. CB01531 TaxID=1718947 RepID=UPI00093F51F7|nr:ammonium transporter [Micromonospora sp. CB01531]